MSHHHSADHTENTDDHFTQEFWDARYRSRTVWSGNPNPLLVEYAAGLTPGTVLDVGSGEGADAIWLASRGWQVTGADLSTVALEHAARNAAEAGEDIAGRITWQHADFLTWDPAPGGSTWCRRSSCTFRGPRSKPCTAGWPPR